MSEKIQLLKTKPGIANAEKDTTGSIHWSGAHDGYIDDQCLEDRSRETVSLELRV